MPAGMSTAPAGGGTYRSLAAVNGPNADVVYRSTTTMAPANTPGMLLDTVRKAFSFVSTSSSPTKGEKLIDVSKTPIILSSRYCMFLLEWLSLCMCK